ncbi:MAG TPA: HAMP domain-containing sensor histidine kinase, partial [Polyangiaceae bacterium]
PSADASKASEALESISDLTQACRQLESLLAEGLLARQAPLGPLTLRKKHHSVATLVSSAVRRIGKRALLADIEIDVTGAPDLMAVLDPELCGRVLDNLLDNALRVSPSGTKISVHFGDCSGELVISITDQGPGVPENDRERIFEMYGTSPTLPGTRGTAGIGLAFCRKVAEAHGGRVILDDRPKGASFVVTFPIFGCER